MTGGCWRIASGIVLGTVAVAGLAGCGQGSSSATASSTLATGTDGGYSASMLRGALLTRVNGVPAAATKSIGDYGSLSAASLAKQAASGVQVTPKACAGAAATGFNPGALASAPAATSTFSVGNNAVSEVLIASTTESAAAALAGQVPAECSQYQEKIAGKTYTFGVKEQSVSGIGQQARVVNVAPTGAKSEDLWSIIYRGKGFVGTVTVVGPNASKQAVTELAQQSYAYADKSLH